MRVSSCMAIIHRMANEKNTAAEPAEAPGEPAFRYNATLAQDIETKWQKK